MGCVSAELTECLTTLCTFLYYWVLYDTACCNNLRLVNKWHLKGQFQTGFTGQEIAFYLLLSQSLLCKTRYTHSRTKPMIFGWWGKGGWHSSLHREPEKDWISPLWKMLWFKKANIFLLGFLFPIPSRRGEKQFMSCVWLNGMLSF